MSTIIRGGILFRTALLRGFLLFFYAAYVDYCGARELPSIDARNLQRLSWFEFRILMPSIDAEACNPSCHLKRVTSKCQSLRLSIKVHCPGGDISWRGTTV